MLPSHERLDADHVSRRQVALRLVEHDELVVRRAPAAGPPTRASRPARSRPARRVQLATPLRRPSRRTSQHPRAAAACRRPRRAPGRSRCRRSRRLELDPGDRARPFRASRNFVARRHRALAAVCVAAASDRELVAAEPSHGVALADHAHQRGVRRARGAASPLWWPSVSLISLNRSRSISRTAVVSAVRRARAIACSRRSWKSSRFGRPVRLSCRDWCRISPT